MKKRILLILCVCALLLSLAACNIGGSDGDSNSGSSDDTASNGDGGTNDEGNKAPDGAIYGAGVSTKVVVKKGEDVDVFAMIDKIEYLTGESVDLVNDSTDKAASEIVIGSTAREISQKAQLLMERAIEDTPVNTEDYGFLIYFSI